MGKSDPDRDRHFLCFFRYDAEGAASFASARLWDDGVIDPADTRRVLSMALTASAHEQNHLDSNKQNQTYGVFRM